MTPPFTLLLCTNGCETTQPALEYGVWLAGLLKARTLLLGVVEIPSQQESVERMVAETAGHLERVGISYQVEMGQGRGSLVISRTAHSGKYLTVAGPLGRPAWRRFVQGRSFRRLLEKIETPILYVPRARLPIRNVLLCMGGLQHAKGVEQLSLYLAREAGARVTLLHVVEPITLEYPVTKEIHQHWENILETDTPQGRNLQGSLAKAREIGLQADFKVRQGSIVHEILDEARHGEYDLVAMGSPYSTQSLRHLYMPNVTAEVAEAILCPVLTVRQGYELVSNKND